MSVHAIKTEFRIYLLGFLSIYPDRQPWLSDAERRALSGEIELPRDLWGEFSYTDDVEISEFRVTFPNQAQKTFDLPEGKSGGERGLRVSELLDAGSFIRIEEKGETQFTGYITAAEPEYDADSADNDWSVRGVGLEGLISETELLVDHNAQDSEKTIQPSAAARDRSARIRQAIAGFTKTIKNLRYPQEMVRALARAALGLLPEGRWGGKKITELLNIDIGVSGDVYTENFIHVVNWLSSARFGQRISFWRHMQTFAQPPLYDMFVKHDQKPIRLDGDTIIRGTRDILVYRKTPWKGLVDPPVDDDGSVYVMDPSRLMRFSAVHDVHDIYSGIYVGLRALDLATGIIINPPLYNPALLEQFAQRVLMVELDGVSFPERNESARSRLQAKLQEIESDLYDVFGKGERNVSGRIFCHYSARTERGKAGISKGKILFIDEELPPGFQLYDNVFYLSGIEVRCDSSTFTPEMGLRVKWGRKATRYRN